MTSSPETNRTLAASIFWEVSRHWNGAPIATSKGRKKPMTVQLALDSLNKALEYVHSGTSLYWKIQELINSIIENQKEGAEGQAENLNSAS